MLHKSNVEWPCLSIDVLVRERSVGGVAGSSDYKRWFPSQVGGGLAPGDTVVDKRLGVEKHKNDNYPMTAYFCAGSQAV